MPVIDHIASAAADAAARSGDGDEASRTRCRRIRGACSLKQGGVIDDYLLGTKYISLRCPRRSGKSWSMAALAAFAGEVRPFSRILVISLTLKTTKENYWSGSPSGLFAMDRQFDLNLKYHHTDLVWYHENGSRGRLAGAETKADLEYLRGAAAEADLIIVDECKSFAPHILDEMIRDVLEPGLMTRDGVLVMGGTPGLMRYGSFFEATSETARVPDERFEDGRPTCIPYSRRLDPYYAPFLDDEHWSLHAWTVQDNTAAPHQWKRALKIKEKAGWADDNATWRREYLGEWADDGDGLVYAYARLRDNPGHVNWYPKRDESVTGLPANEGPWHLVMGLDFGFEDETALVLSAYSESVGEFRQIYEYKSPHLLPDQVALLIERTIDKYGVPDAIVGDAGSLGGKVYVETIAQRHGIHIEPAEKTQKYDHIELLNSDFAAGRVKILPGSELERELLGLQWDLSKAPKRLLAHTGRLREDPKAPNHLCDAMLYSWRFAYHYFASRDADGPEKYTPAWYELKEREAEARTAGEGPFERTYTSDGYPGTDTIRYSKWN